MDRQERRRSPRTTVTDLYVSVRTPGFFGKKIDKNAEILDLSSTGIGIKLNSAIEINKNYLIGFELHWLNETRDILVRVINCVELDDGSFRSGLKVIRDEFCTLSFIATAIIEKKRQAKDS